MCRADSGYAGRSRITIYLISYSVIQNNNLCKGGLQLQKRGMVAAFVILVMFALIALYVLISYSRIQPDEGKICKGIRVDGIEIGDMTADEAIQAINAHTAGKKNQKIEVDVNGKLVETTVGEVGYTLSAGDFLEQAMAVGRSGNMIENYRAIKEAAAGKFSYPIKMELDEAVLKEFVKKRCKKLCTQVKNATVKMENGQFVYTKSRDGVRLDVDVTCQMIREAVEGTEGNDAIHIIADVQVEQPKVSQETVARCKDKIGTFSTVYSAGNVNRSKNLANAARLIDGSVLYPGETFSVHDAISPLTEENGYYEAASYNNGKVEDSLGGGVCQVSTTLYNAVLRAELEIVTRSPHSMVVSYVEPSMDAAIAGDYKDFKFKNNTEVPIYIQGGTQNSTIYFHIYGEETRSPSRQVRFESEVTDTIQPGADKVTYDKTKPESYMTVTQEAHTGYKAKLWKIVTENGKETKTQVNASTYSASPRYVTRGSMKAPEKTAKPKETKKPEAARRPRATKKPDAGTSEGRTDNGQTGDAGSGTAGDGSADGAAPVDPASQGGENAPADGAAQ